MENNVPHYTISWYTFVSDLQCSRSLSGARDPVLYMLQAYQLFRN